MVTVKVEVVGPLNEEWYCPAFEIIWPDGTISGRETECDPWEDLPEGVTVYPDEGGEEVSRYPEPMIVRRPLPPGDWEIIGVARKGKWSKRAVARVKIIGGDQ